MASKNSYLNIKENRLLTVLFLLILVALLCGLMYICRDYIFSLLMALIFFFPLKALNEKILTVFRKRWISSGVLTLILLVAVSFFVFYVLTELASQTYQLYVFLMERINDGLIQQIQENPVFIKALSFFDLNPYELAEQAMAASRKYIPVLFSDLTSIITVQIDLAGTFLCILLILFFLLKDGTNLGPWFYRTLPFPDDLEMKVVQRLKKVVNVLITGNLCIMFLQGLMLFAGLKIADIPAPLLWGAIGSVLSLIPVIGTSLIWIPASLYLVLTGSYMTALFTAVWSLSWYLVLENLLKPYIFGETLNFHPLILFFLLMGSIHTFGLPGIFLGPIILSLFVSMWEIYRMLDLYNEAGRNAQPVSESEVSRKKVRK